MTVQLHNQYVYFQCFIYILLDTTFVLSVK